MRFHKKPISMLNASPDAMGGTVIICTHDAANSTIVLTHIFYVWSFMNWVKYVAVPARRVPFEAKSTGWCNYYQTHDFIVANLAFFDTRHSWWTRAYEYIEVTVAQVMSIFKHDQYHIKQFTLFRKQPTVHFSKMCDIQLVTWRESVSQFFVSIKPSDLLDAK